MVDSFQAGQPYARSVQGTHPLPPPMLPSPELLFDTLLKREGETPHPAGLSSHFFAFANLIIHCVRRSDDLSASTGILIRPCLALQH